MKYILFEQSAVEKLINDAGVQSIEFEQAIQFIRYMRGTEDDLALEGIVSQKTKNGVIFAGKGLTKIFLLIDLEKCAIGNVSDSEWLTILQKLFRFSVRFWNSLPLTSCEKIFKNKAAVYPFPFTAGSAFHVVLRRSPEIPRLEKRGINKGLLAYNYSNESTYSLDREGDPDFSIYRLGGEEYVQMIPDLSKQLQKRQQEVASFRESSPAIHIIEAEHTQNLEGFRYMPFERQFENLTQSQKKVVNCAEINTPIRIEGPAGTGKTASLVLRAVKLLKTAKEKSKEIKIIFFTHSRSTQEVIEEMFYSLTGKEWIDSLSQSIKFVTLLSYCADYVDITESALVDKDAYDAKQYQLLLIQDAYKEVSGNVFNTYKLQMSDTAVRFFEQEQMTKILLMLQHEFSVRIKGMAEGDLERYKKLEPLESGLPLSDDDDKEFVYRIFQNYQKILETLAVYDTDDVILEALARLNAPLWRRSRGQAGFDYLFVDEMHLFNLNEQQVFHHLTKDPGQKSIPICFALDYSQAIGERGDISQNYFEREIGAQSVVKHEYSTIFRSSQQIAELCAAITASGALLFHNFINPYKTCQSGFTALEEEKSKMPVLYMCQNDKHILAELDVQIKRVINEYKCQPNEIALIAFQHSFSELRNTDNTLGGFKLNFLESKNDGKGISSRKELIFTYPEYVNGLEFKVVILLGVDSGRVPPSDINDISRSFLYYSALNELYLACSRAKYSVIMFGSQVYGVSECLKHAIECGVLNMKELEIH